MEVLQDLDRGVQHIKDVVVSGINDITNSSAYRSVEPDIIKTAYALKRDAGNVESSVTRYARGEVSNIKNDITKVRGAATKELATVEARGRQIANSVHADWDKFDSYVVNQKNRLEGAISNGIDDVHGWWNSEVTGLENGLMTLLIIGGVLIYVFKEEVGTGSEYLYKGAKSTGKFVINKAKEAAPYAPLLLL